MGRLIGYARVSTADQDSFSAMPYGVQGVVRSGFSLIRRLGRTPHAPAWQPACRPYAPATHSSCGAWIVSAGPWGIW